ncbi:tRNA(Ile)-lysidine synthase [Lentilactobacillus fungorum]|uniref:tRNA(Ile)-lysidine synthase n=1 Tax=Lentilactobacillus fungorum TaxID=2201250 RepID=A0ABQ3VW87_9LACO|nr:tRNA lysidine(34) synthetase TilS [Lentilactobacillus fungorum]GHP13160.1 tRNA(Ile)-lysidine synthase [Lentilactobacillus fungorum]
MDLQLKFNQLIDQNHWWRAHQKVVVAVSTGVDSMTLLYLLAHLKRRLPTIIVAYVDHQLRQASQLETAFIQKLCQEQGFKLAMTTWPKAEHPAHGIEAAARKFRYNFFMQVLADNQAQYLLTAHHGDDLIETVVMKLIRGGQLTSLAGIDEQRSFGDAMLIRPLLRFSKKAIRQFAERHKIRWFEDETNQDLTIQRNRIRHQVVPMLKKENPQLIAHVFDYSTQIQTTTRALDELLAQVIKQVCRLSVGEASIDLNVFDTYSVAVKMSILKEIMMAKLKIVDVSTQQLYNILELVDDLQKPQGEIDLAHGWRAIKSYQQLIITKKSLNQITSSKTDERFMVVLERWYSLANGYRFGIFLNRPSKTELKVTEFNLTPADLPLVAKPAQPGDRLLLKGGGSQKVSRVLINAKIANQARKRTMVLQTARQQIVAVLGVKSVSIPAKANNAQTLYLVEHHQINFSKGKGIENG